VQVLEKREGGRGSGEGEKRDRGKEGREGREVREGGRVVRRWREKWRGGEKGRKKGA
jgi:hypothetical protein